jgi:hypothetical protein
MDALTNDDLRFPLCRAVNQNIEDNYIEDDKNK